MNLDLDITCIQHLDETIVANSDGLLGGILSFGSRVKLMGVPESFTMILHGIS